MWCGGCGVDVYGVMYVVWWVWHYEWGVVVWCDVYGIMNGVWCYEWCGCGVMFLVS